MTWAAGVWTHTPDEAVGAEKIFTKFLEKGAPYSKIASATYLAKHISGNVNLPAAIKLRLV